MTLQHNLEGSPLSREQTVQQIELTLKELQLLKEDNTFDDTKYPLLITTLFDLLHENPSLLQMFSNNPDKKLDTMVVSPTDISTAFEQILFDICELHEKKLKDEIQALEMSLQNSNIDVARQVDHANKQYEISLAESKKLRIDEGNQIQAAEAAAALNSKAREEELRKSRHSIELIKDSIERIQAEGLAATAESKRMIQADKDDLEKYLAELKNKDQETLALIESEKMEIQQLEAELEEFKENGRIHQQELKERLEQQTVDSFAAQKAEIGRINAATAAYLKQQEDVSIEQISRQKAEIDHSNCELDRANQELDQAQKRLDISSKEDQLKLEAYRLETDRIISEATDKIETQKRRNQLEADEREHRFQDKTLRIEQKRADRNTPYKNWMKHNKKKVVSIAVAAVTVTVFANLAEDSKQFKGTIPGMDVINKVSDTFTEPFTVKYHELMDKHSKSHGISRGD